MRTRPSLRHARRRRLAIEPLEDRCLLSVNPFPNALPGEVVELDETGPRVVASSLRDGDVVGLGDLLFAARFDEELMADYLDASDVQLVGQHSGEHLPVVFDYQAGTSTLNLDFADLPDDIYALTLRSGDGAFEDLSGNDLDGEADPNTTVPSGDGLPGGDFVVNFVADADVLRYPTPLLAKQPLGSLIYDPTAAGSLGISDDESQDAKDTRTSTDSDTWTIDLDANQTVTVVVNTSSELQVTFDVLDPAGNVIGSATAAAPGETAVVQTAVVIEPGTYRTVLSAVSGTGTYTIQLMLNAALEQESYAGTSNDTPETAEDLDATFISLGGQAERGAVIGSPSPGLVMDCEDFESGVLDGQWTTYSSKSEGRIQITDAYGAADGSYALLMDRESAGSYNLNEAIWTVDLSGLANPRLSFYHAEWNDEERFLSGPFTDHYSADGVSISADGVQWYPVFHVPDLLAGEWRWYPIDLAVRAEQAGITLGPDFQIKFQQYGNDSLTAAGRGYDQIKITTPDTLSGDWYRFSLADGESVSLASTKLTSGSGSLQLELFDSNQQPLARGVAAQNVDQAIHNFVDRTNDALPQPYYARVSGDVWTGYSLVVTRNAAFDLEPNSVDLGPLDITADGVALGYAESLDSVAVTERQTLLPHDSSFWDLFGNSIHVDGDTAIVGAYHKTTITAGDGAAYILQFDGQRWNEQQKLMASDGGREHYFGSSVAFSGDWAVVGAPRDYPGSAYLFHFDGSRWVETQKLRAFDADGLSSFGGSVAIHGDTAFVVSGNETENDVGAIFVFQFDGNRWLELQKLVPSNAADEGFFGGPLSFDGNTLLVGTRTRVTGEYRGKPGAAYVYQFDGNQWIEQQKLSVSDPPVDDPYGGRFGESVAISGQTAVVGMSGESHAGNSSGAACIFQFDGAEWVFQQKLTALDAAEGDRFGRSVAVDGNTVVVTATGDDIDGVPGVGSAYAFRFLNGQWVQRQKFFSSTARPGGQSGYSASVSRDTIFVGNPSGVPGGGGEVFVFSVPSGEDGYTVNARAGDVLTIRTATPGGGPREFVNVLDPKIELYDPAGILVASNDNGASDGRNALLTYSANVTGTYTVQVLACDQTAGEYVLSVEGHTGFLPPFRVTDTIPAQGGILSAGNPSVRIDLDDAVLISSLNAADLRVDGIPATAVTLLDGDTLFFDLQAGLSEGLHEVTIVAGAILDLQGTPVEPFSATLVVDATAPRIVESSVLEGSILPTGYFVYTARFDEPLQDLMLGPEDVLLVGAVTGVHSVSTFVYDPTTSTITIRFSGYSEDDYTLTLLSGDGAFEDLADNDLDGEAASMTTVPTGNGQAGGDFVVHFSLRETAVARRHIFYNGSAFDGRDPAANGLDFDAIATDKLALLPGQAATFANYTSYSRGINGIMIYITHPYGAITADDFEFAVGNDNNPANWLPAATPTVDVQSSQTTTRVTMTWPDNTIQNQWLQVTVLANENTELAEPDVFYFGNAVGETGNSDLDAKVDVFDVLETRDNPRPFFDPAGIDTVHDFNRDKRVNAIDTLIARNHQTWSGTALRLIDLSQAPAAAGGRRVGLRSLTHPTNSGTHPANLPRSDFRLEWLYEVDVTDIAGRPGDAMSQKAVDRLLALLVE